VEVAIEACTDKQADQNAALMTLSTLLEARAALGTLELDATMATTLAGGSMCVLLESYGATLSLVEPATTEDVAGGGAEEAATGGKVCEAMTPDGPGGGGDEADAAAGGTPGEGRPPSGQPGGSEVSPGPAAGDEAPPPAVPRRGGALRQQCEAHGIPVGKLGTFLAAEVLREVERLSQLTLEDLRGELQASGLQTIVPGSDGPGGGGHKELLARLTQVHVWRAMPTPALRTECRERASDVVEATTGQSGRVLDREELVEALMVATYGGCTRNEQVREQCRAKHIPVERLEGLDQAERLLREAERLERSAASDLKNSYKTRGFAPPANLSKENLVLRMTELLAWDEMPLSALRDVCKERRLGVRGDQRRPELLQLLAAATWEERGIPIGRFPNSVVAHGLLDQADRFEARSVAELRADCRKRALPFEALGEKQDLVRCLTAVIVWEQLPLEELRRDCLELCGAAAPAQGGSGAGGDDDHHTSSFSARFAADRLERRDLMQRLVRATLFGLWRERGIDERITDHEVAEELFREIGRLEAMPEEDLREEYLKRGLPPEVGAGRQDLADRLTRVLVWQRLPFAELKKEGQSKGVVVKGGVKARGEAEHRAELVEQLFVALVRAAWEACGIPVRRLGSMQVAAAVVARLTSLDAMADADLKKEYLALGLPAEADGLPRTKEDLMSHLQMATIWKEMALKELQKDCRELDVSCHDVGSKLTDAEHRRELLHRLMTGLVLKAWLEEGVPVRRVATLEAATRVKRRVGQLASMANGDLLEEYGSLGLPTEPARLLPGMDGLLTRLTEVARWRELSVKELQNECKHYDVTSGGISSKSDDSEQRHELVERLTMALCADAWEGRQVPVKRMGSIRSANELGRRVERLRSMACVELRKEYEGLGLPAEASRAEPCEEEQLERLQLVALWRSLPPYELRKECIDLSVSAVGLSSTETSQHEVVERLILVSYADAWEDVIPLRRLGSIREADSLIKRLRHLDALGDSDIRGAHAALGLPADADVPSGVTELLARLKKVALWRALQVHELRKDCQELRAGATGEDPDELVQRLILASWGPPAAKPRREAVPPPFSASSKKSVPGQKNFWAGAFPGQQRRWHDSFLAPFKDPMERITRAFQALQVPPTASPEEVRKAYRKLALKHHPDKNPGRAEEEATRKFREVTAAYEELCEYFGRGGGAGGAAR